MLVCRSCGKPVGQNRFCSDCMTYTNVIKVKNEDELLKPHH